jgi:hypothetical protein
MTAAFDELRAERDHLRKLAAEERISPTQADKLDKLERLLSEAPTERELPVSTDG